MKRFWLLSAVLLVLLTASASASTVWYYDRESWMSAVSGHKIGTVDFENIVQDNQFVLEPNFFTVGGITFQQEGANNPYMLIIGSAVSGGNYDWGSGASLLTGSRGYSGPNSYLQINFPKSSAVAFEVFTVSDFNDPVPDILHLVLHNGDSTFVQTPFVRGTPAFIGFTTDDHGTYLGIYAENYYAGIDNVSYVANPEPASLVLLGTGLGLIGFGVKYRARKN